MAQWHLGTMGFSYKEWAGVFYPPGMKPGEYLSYYSQHFDAVELDTTFYATPPAERVRKWAAAVPDSFRFAAKAPRAVTHEGEPDQAIDAMKSFLDVMRHMGEKLGVIVLQFPPRFSVAHFDSLDRLLAALPPDIRFAVELRHSSWGTARTLEMLRQHRCALVHAEYRTRPSQLHVTSDLLYLRWVGEHNRFAQRDHEQIDVGPSLDWWADQLQRVGPQVQSIWGFFNNDYAGYAIGTCQRFRSMLGLPPPPAPAYPQSLF